MPAKTAVAVVLALMLSASTAWAQNVAGPADRAFRVEWEPRWYMGGPAIRGYVFNDSLRLVTNVWLRVERVGADSHADEPVFGWVFGDIASGGRGYFVVSVPSTEATYRVSIASFDVVSGGGASIPEAPEYRETEQHAGVAVHRLSVESHLKDVSRWWEREGRMGGSIRRYVFRP